MNGDGFLRAVSALLRPTAAKAYPNRLRLAFKAESVDAVEGVIIAKLSKAELFDRENERIPLDVLKRATYELVRKIGLKSVSVDVNHGAKSIACDVLQAWIGDPMPDSLATYVMLKPHDRSLIEAAKAGRIHGMSWSGPYKLRPAS